MRGERGEPGEAGGGAKTLPSLWFPPSPPPPVFRGCPGNRTAYLPLLFCSCQAQETFWGRFSGSTVRAELHAAAKVPKPPHGCPPTQPRRPAPPTPAPAAEGPTGGEKGKNKCCWGWGVLASRQALREARPALSWRRPLRSLG